MFTAGVGLLISTISVFLRDMFYIYGIILTIWNYVTPIFWNISMLDGRAYQVLFTYNPLYVFINGARNIILFGERPSGLTLLVMFLIGAGMLFIGSYVFRKKQDKFIYYA